MNTLDTVILVTIVIGLVRGVMTGGIKQILSLAGILLAFIIAAKTSDGLGRRVAEGLGAPESLAPAIGFAIIFAGIQATAYGLARLLRSFLEKLKLGVLDKILGGGIGIFKSVLVVSLILFLAAFVGIPDKATQTESVFYKRVYPVMPATWEFITGRIPEIKDTAKNAVDSLIVPEILPDLR